MSEVPDRDPIDDVAAGDLIGVDRSAGEQLYKVVFKDATDAGYVVTLEADDGETFQRDFEAGTPVTRSLESKWESEQSPSPHSE
jgi:hypothetical protein